MNDCALSILWHYVERSVRVVAPELLLMKGETLSYREDLGRNAKYL